MQQRRNILFDLDGTLTDPEAGITGSIAYALQQMQATVPPQAELRRFIGPPLRDTFMRILGNDTASLAALEHYRQRYDVDGAMFDAAPFTDIPAVLTRLKAEGKRLFVATAKPHVMARKILDHFKLAPFFEAIHGPELDGTRNDKGELIAYIRAQHGITPEESVMIGDRLHDIRAARHNAMASIGVLWGFGSHDELHEAGADHIVANPQELSALLCA